MYSWKDGARIKADANIAGKICEELVNTGGLTPQRLLDVSRAEDAPLHDEFEWDDSIAAEKYREGQAAHIIRCLVTTVDEAPDRVIRAYFTFKTEAHEYIPSVDILNDSEKRAKLLDQAYRELQAFKNKYKVLRELAEVFRAIDNLGGEAQ